MKFYGETHAVDELADDVSPVVAVKSLAGKKKWFF